MIHPRFKVKSDTEFMRFLELRRKRIADDKFSNQGAGRANNPASDIR